MKQSELSNGTNENSKEETRECNRNALPEERNRDSRKRRNVSVSESGMSSTVKRKQSIGEHQSYVHCSLNAAVQYIKDRSSLPFPGASQCFYARQNKKAITNAKRIRQREQLPVTQDETKLVGMQRSRVDEPLGQNIDVIKRELICCKNGTRKAEPWAMADVREKLLKSFVLETSQAAEIYSK